MPGLVEFIESSEPRLIAFNEYVSPHTVNSHLRHVFSKLGITSRVELARVARDYEIA